MAKKRADRMYNEFEISKRQVERLLINLKFQKKELIKCSKT